MNAVLEQITEPTIDAAIAAVKDAVVQLRLIEGEHLADQGALALIRERETGATAKLQEFHDQDAAARDRYSRRAEEDVRSGGTGAIPVLMPTEKHMLAQIAAQKTLAALTHTRLKIEGDVRASAAKVATQWEAVQSSLAQLRAVEIHFRIFDGLELLDKFEGVFAEVYARTESRGDSHFGDPIHDGDREHQKLRAVWNVLESRRLGPASPAITGVLTPQPPLTAARAALAARDAELINPPAEQPS